jgi:hypothetical protein
MEFLQVGSFLPLIKNMQAAVESAKENDETIESFLANFFQKKRKRNSYYQFALVSLSPFSHRRFFVIVGRLAAL